MRKFIVRRFALSYIFRVFGLWNSMPRAATIIMPFMILGGIFSVLDMKTGIYITLIPLSIAIYLGFIYFSFYPVKFEELDNSQKIQMYDAYLLGKTTSILTEQEKEEARNLMKNSR